MIFAERITTILTMAVMPKDNLTTDTMVIGDVSVIASGIGKDIIEHSTGYFLFTDLSEGIYQITAGGTFYKHDDFTIDTTYINPEQPFVDIFLNPNANYPFPEGITVLKGKITDTEYKPLPEVSITIEGMTESAISENNGNFFILFDSINEDSNIHLHIVKNGYESRQIDLLLEKDTTTRNEPIKLTEK